MSRTCTIYYRVINPRLPLCTSQGVEVVSEDPCDCRYTEVRLAEVDTGRDYDPTDALSEWVEDCVCTDHFPCLPDLIDTMWIGQAIGDHLSVHHDPPSCLSDESICELGLDEDGYRLLLRTIRDVYGDTVCDDCRRTLLDNDILPL